MASLYAKSNEELFSLLSLEKPFQAKIVTDALVKGVTDFSLMTSLPKALRERLSGEYPTVLSSKVIARSDSDSAVKLAVEMDDGSVVECVRLSDGDGRHTACLSSQVGCAMGCAFCSTGTLGLGRNLSAGEIVEEFVHLEKLGSHITHIVFMGMGEPMANFTAVMDAVAFLHREDGFNISYRRITISTCGLVPGIRRLSELKIPVKLAVSLVTADNALRSSIMPVNKSFPLEDLKNAIMAFQHKSGKRVTLEYCMLGGINTGEKDAEDLRRFARGLDVLVNLIPWNPVDNMEFRSPSEREVRAFMQYLRKRGINASLRREKGRSADAACGQLAAKNIRKRN